MTQEIPAETDVPVADLSKAPLPTEKTLKRRGSLPFQVGRFALFNLRIIRLVNKGHGHA
ncbi:hypothetical protein [Nocardioides sp.]|uniref:hypothetical protein n=1 Tax=Nocardioides sp. TaxID=35761 RepID=UPI00356869D4